MTSIYLDGIEYRAFGSHYLVSKVGLVVRLKGITCIEPKFLNSGYHYVAGRHLVHRMVAACWLEKPNIGNHVHHLNGIKTDNRAENLEWVTPKIHMAERHKGMSGHYERTESTRQKLREYRLGKTHKPETIAKIRKASLDLGCKPPPRPLGYKCSKNAIAKMRENSPNATRCQIDGVQYRSYSEAGEKLKIKLHTIRKRCLSNNFKNYETL